MGVRITDDTKHDTPISFRRHAGEEAFFANKELFVSKALSLRKRMNDYERHIQLVVLFGAGEFAMSCGSAQRIQRWENGMLCRIAGLKRKPDEKW